MPVALITAADGVCHPTPAALMSADSADIVFTHTAAVQIANERTKTIRDGEIGPEQSATVYLIAGGHTGGIGSCDGRR